ncbi:MAG TPA: TIGR03560 family F420-dependent LLM class oxidoreductase [Patescibacteria group bacterium]|nr:TIGR03560 family F420-dependent LLM class oxidoreductase [Patescibacteria group bacterium]
MRYALMIEPQQGCSYLDQLAIARHAEAAGFEALFRSDHYDSFPGELGHPTTDAWTVVAGLARETDRIRLGVLVSPVTFRHPGTLAKIVATVDEMSGGRVIVGLGAGWNEGEHAHHGFEFPPIEVRAEMLEEQLAILRGLWQEPDGWSFAGRHYTVPGSLFRPRPVQRPAPHVIVGGEGSPRSMRIAVRFADEFNLSSSTPERAAERFARLDETARAAGRDPSTLMRSSMVGVLVGRDSAEVERRTGALLAQFGLTDDGATWLATRRPRWILGTPTEARAMAGRFAAVGVERLVLQDFLPWDLEMIDLLGEVLVRG